MRRLTTRQVVNWLRPWPIAFRRHPGRWALRVVPISATYRLAGFWRPDERKPTLRSVGWWAARARKGTMGGSQHYVHMLATHQIPTMASLTVLVTWRKKERRWTVVDGNHHLIAAVLVKRHRWRRLRMKLTHVGVLVRGEPGRRSWAP